MPSLYPFTLRFVKTLKTGRLVGLVLKEELGFTSEKEALRWVESVNREESFSVDVVEIVANERSYSEPLRP